MRSDRKLSSRAVAPRTARLQRDAHRLQGSLAELVVRTVCVLALLAAVGLFIRFQLDAALDWLRRLEPPRGGLPTVGFAIGGDHTCSSRAATSPEQCGSSWPGALGDIQTERVTFKR